MFSIIFCFIVSSSDFNFSASFWILLIFWLIWAGEHSKVWAICINSCSFSCANFATFGQVTIMILLIQLATASCQIILKAHKKLVFGLWVPPQSCISAQGIFITLTFSQYFSSKNALAHFFIASSKLVSKISTGIAW